MGRETGCWGQYSPYDRSLDCLEPTEKQGPAPIASATTELLRKMQGRERERQESPQTLTLRALKLDNLAEVTGKKP